MNWDKKEIAPSWNYAKPQGPETGSKEEERLIRGAKGLGYNNGAMFSSGEPPHDELGPRESLDKYATASAVSARPFPSLTIDRAMFGGYVVHEKGGAGPLYVSVNLSEALAFIEQHIAKAGG